MEIFASQRSVTHVARYFHALYGRSPDCGPVGIHAVVLWLPGKNGGIEVVGFGLSRGSCFGRPVDARRAAAWRYVCNGAQRNRIRHMRNGLECSAVVPWPPADLSRTGDRR